MHATSEPVPPWSVTFAALALYAAAAVQVTYAAMVAVTARTWDRVWQSFDRNGDFSAEAGTLIAISVAWIGLAAVFAVLTTWLGSARKASLVGVCVLGVILVAGNLGGARVLAPRDPNRPDSARLQAAMDEFLPVWYQVVPVWVLAIVTALMTVVGLGLLLTPSSWRFFTGLLAQPRRLV